MTSIRDESLGLGRDGHLLLLHRSEAERHDALVRWVRRGLELGERVVFTEPDDDPAERSLPSVLRQRGIDVQTVLADGRLHPLPVPEYFPEAGQIQLLHQARAAGFSAIRMCCEARAALTVLSTEAYAEVESTLEFLCRTKPVSALCQYGPLETPEWLLQNGYQTHPELHETQMHIRRQDNSLVLSGEVDQQNSDILESALRVATESADEMFWVDLRRVTFLEVHACRAIVLGTQSFRDAGGDVILHGPTGGALRALRLLGVHLQPRFTIVKERP